VSRRRTAREDPGAAWCVARPADAIRSDDFDRRKVRNRCIDELDAPLQIRRRRIKTLKKIIDARGCLLDERNGDRLRPGLQRQSYFERNRRTSLSAASNVVI